MKIRSNSQSCTASALVAVIITITILALPSGFIVVNVNNRRMTGSQASGWQEALAAAEAGLHQGIAQLEQGLAQNSLPLAGAVPITTWPSPFPTWSSPSASLNHGGEGSSSSTYEYDMTLNKKSINVLLMPYYCIVSTGKYVLPVGKTPCMDIELTIMTDLNLQSSIRN